MFEALLPRMVLLTLVSRECALDDQPETAHIAGVNPAAPYTWWADDVRGNGRAVRVSAHTEGGFLVVSTWKAGECVGTVRLLPAEAADLVSGIASGLAELAAPVLAD